MYYDQVITLESQRTRNIQKSCTVSYLSLILLILCLLFSWMIGASSQLYGQVGGGGVYSHSASYSFPAAL